MKNITIILSILCLIAVNQAYHIKNDEKLRVDECARELNMTNIKKFYEIIRLKDYLTNRTDDMDCMTACLMRKTANDNAITLYAWMLQIVNKAYEDGFESVNFTHRYVESKIESCFLKDHAECNFYKCVDPFNSPFINVFYYLIVEAVLQDIANKLSS